MASGNTITSNLQDSLPEWIMKARQVREFEGVVPQLVERQKLGEGLGLTWHEVSFAKLNAQAITETTVLDNPQQLSDTDFAITPTMIGIQTLITDRVALRISKTALAKTGGLAQNAIQRKKNDDGITMFDGFSTSYPGSGSTTLASGHISSAIAVITGNSTEPGNPPYRCVLHGFQLKDIDDEIVAGVGTYPIDEGLTARVFKERFRGMIAGAQLYEDGNIPTTGNEAKGAVFAQEAIVLVEGRAPRAVAVRKEEIGGGATAVYHYDEYAYGERLDTWGVEIHSDATTPTS